MTKKNRLSTLEEIIADLIRNSPDAYLDKNTIIDVLQLSSKKELRRLDKAINSLSSKKMIKIQGDALHLLKTKEERKDQKDGRITGTIQITPHGTGYVVVEDMEQDIKINSRDTDTALYGDIVEVEVYSDKRKRSQPKGRVKSIVRRGKDFYVGTLKQTKANTYVIEPDTKSAHINFFVLPDNLNGAQSGDKVTFILHKWVHPRALPEAHITNILGQSGSNEANILSILAENELIADFPSEVEAFAERIPYQIPREEAENRRDMRKEKVFTIDPADAKDFDDALSIKMLDNGNYYLGVHIADVTHYMQTDSILDKEAYLRGTSIYLVDRVIPMLPERLSNGVCSLRPNEEKLTYSCFMEIDKQGNLMDYSIEETIIHSKQRFAYEDAQAILDGKEHEFGKEVHLAGKLAKTLMNKRFREGAIDFDTPEPKFVLNEQGKPVDVILKKRLFAHRLIEECMLMANKTVATHIDNIRQSSGKKRSKNLYPFFYRVHDKPDTEKLGAVAEQVKPIGISFDPGNKITPKAINKLLNDVKETTVEVIVNELTLRAMAKAEYTPDNLGHFGLGFEHYAHFTSPIRRYPDVIVHRLLKSYGRGTRTYTYDALKKHGIHCSQRERVAVDAERDSIKLKQVEYLADHVGDTFEGVISGVTERGIFVNLKDIHCEGMVRVGDLKGDYYVYNNRNHSLIGRSSKKKFQLGDTISVIVDSVNHQKRQIDFKPAQ